ncbi:hypothetical protein Tsubulata_035241, partial [Turnera subulata]
MESSAISISSKVGEALKQMAPIEPVQNLAASLLNGEAVLAKVDATAETGLAKRFHIQGYPTIMMFVNGVSSGVYYDERTGLEGADSEELYVASKQHLDIDFYITTDADVARFLHIGDNRPALAVMRKINGKSTISEFISALKSLPTANPFDDDKMRAEKQVFNGLSDQEKSSWLENAMIGDLSEKPMDIVSSNERTMMNMFPGDLETSWPDKAIANPVNDHVDSSRRDEPMVDEKDVVVLTIENFSGFVARNQYVMLNFYAPWCTWSQKLAPEYAAAATILKDEVVLAKIDATAEPELAKLYEIKEYPTVYLLVGGSQKEAQLLLAHRAVLVMGVLNTLEGPGSDVLRAVSEDHKEVNLYQTANVDVASSLSDDQPVVNALNDHEKSLWSNKGETNIAHNHVESSLEDKPRLVDEKDVLVLTRINISDFLAKNRYVMLVFYAPWCYWSQRLAPEYAAAATLLKDEAALAKVNCTLEVELAREYEIKAYPTMIFLIGEDQKKMNVVAQNVEKTVEAERILADKSMMSILGDKSMMIMAFLDNLQGPDSEEVSAASKLHVDVKFYQTADADVAQSFHIDPEIKRPALVMLKRNAPNGWRIVNFDGPFTRTAISDFVSTYRVPSVITFREEDASRIFDDPLKKLWLFAPRDSWEARNIFEEAAYAFQG